MIALITKHILNIFIVLLMYFLTVTNAVTRARTYPALALILSARSPITRPSAGVRRGTRR